MSHPTRRPRVLPGLLLGAVLLVGACIPKGGDDDTGDDTGDTQTPNYSSGSSDGGNGGGGGGGGTSAGTGDGGGTGSGGGSGGDGVSPRIVDGYAGYSDTGLGVVALFVVEVQDPTNDVRGGTFLRTLNGGTTYEYPIDNDEVTYNPSTGNVSLDFSNVEPEYYRVNMQVKDAAGNPSNVWTGEMTYR